METGGRAPGIKEGRGAAGVAAGAVAAAGIGRAPEGRVGGFPQAEEEDGGIGLRSMMISP